MTGLILYGLSDATRRASDHFLVGLLRLAKRHAQALWNGLVHLDKG
jgi:hypothetical protein